MKENDGRKNNKGNGGAKPNAGRPKKENPLIPKTFRVSEDEIPLVKNYLKIIRNKCT